MAWGQGAKHVCVCVVGRTTGKGFMGRLPPETVRVWKDEVGDKQPSGARCGQRTPPGGKSWIRQGAVLLPCGFRRLKLWVPVETGQFQEGGGLDPHI